MIKFRNIRLKNFLGYSNVFTEIWLDYKPTTILIGESGSGKSSIIESIVFALFGKPFRNINKNQLINSINGADCLVEIDFDIGSNSYMIRRGIKPTVFEIYCNNELINQDSHSRDYQDYLEKNILKMNFKTFTQIVVLGACNFTPFMQLKPLERQALIEDLLDIEIFSVMSSLLKTRMSDIKDSINHLGSELSSHKEKISLYSRYIDTLKEDKQKQIEENNKKIENDSIVVENENKKIQKIEGKIQELKKLITDEQKLAEKLCIYPIYKRDIENKIKRIQKEIKFYEANASCSECDRPFDSEYIFKIVSEKKEKEDSLNDGLNKIIEERSKLDIRYHEIEKVKKDIKTLKDAISERSVKVISIVKYIGKIKTENESLIANQKNVEEETKKLEDLNLKLKELERQGEKLANKKLIHEIASNILKDSGIKAKIMKQYLPVINRLINKFLTEMNFNIIFTLDENFNETIKSRGRDERVYNSLSDGEKQRLDIAILLTWRVIAILKNSIKTNLLFIDELLDSSLDHLATENIIELINNEPSLKNNNIFVISHKATMIDKFSEFIKFEKKGNFSRVVP